MTKRKRKVAAKIRESSSESEEEVITRSKRRVYHESTMADEVGQPESGVKRVKRGGSIEQEASGISPVMDRLSLKNRQSTKRGLPSS